MPVFGQNHVTEKFRREVVFLTRNLVKPFPPACIFAFFGAVGIGGSAVHTCLVGSWLLLNKLHVMGLCLFYTTAFSSFDTLLQLRDSNYLWNLYILLMVG